LLWLNDRVGGIVSVTVQVDHGESNRPVLLIGDAELRHWSSRETEEYLANNLDEERAGCYYLGKRTFIDLECSGADSYVYRANKCPPRDRPRYKGDAANQWSQARLTPSTGSEPARRIEYGGYSYGHHAC
jgi:hypothetical protein